MNSLQSEYVLYSMKIKHICFISFMISWAITLCSCQVKENQKPTTDSFPNSDCEIENYFDQLSYRVLLFGGTELELVVVTDQRAIFGYLQGEPIDSVYFNPYQFEGLLARLSGTEYCSFPESFSNGHEGAWYVYRIKNGNVEWHRRTWASEITEEQVRFSRLIFGYYLGDGLNEYEEFIMEFAL